jgi:hypothetical protein
MDSDRLTKLNRIRRIIADAENAMAEVSLIGQIRDIETFDLIFERAFSNLTLV